ncbi:hypothetical protein [Herbidospora galbida]|uniref:hypothetical protein n=1 Tax=Herbidospora galbida TaxID=2575442 RepID=UPI001BAF7B36|nr:hypothetical protein [Herbidospora galbida]
MAGRDQEALRNAYDDERITAERVDVTDDDSIAALARRIGAPKDIADAVIFAMTNPFFTGVTLRVDGGEPLT